MPRPGVRASVPELVPPFREEHVHIIKAFLVQSVRESGRKGVVVALSGGVDSALVARLCADALGPSAVVALALFDGKGGQDQKDAKRFAKSLGIEFRTVNIAPMVGAIEKRLKASEADRVARGNLRSRVRMITLYYVANTESRLVMGTGNKSEIAVGYFSKYGDGGVDYLPIGDLYKTQVWAMAQYLGLPPDIVRKVPTAGLWPGQTDEGELGMPYAELDRILLGIELQMEPDAIAEKAGVPLDHVQRVQSMVAASAHKRKTPLIPKLGVRTFGLDWRE